MHDKLKRRVEALEKATQTDEQQARWIEEGAAEFDRHFESFMARLGLGDQAGGQIRGTDDGKE